MTKLEYFEKEIKEAIKNYNDGKLKELIVEIQVAGYLNDQIDLTNNN